MKLNKTENTNRWLTVSAKDYTKLPIDNIVFHSFNGLLAKIFRQMVITKEQPKGCLYDEETFQVVVRIIDGKILMNGMADCYAWKKSKVQSAKNKRPIGFSFKGRKTLRQLLATMKSKEEQMMLKDMLSVFRKDLILIHTDAEDRKCIEVTQELYDNGMTMVVDEWMPTDENGMSDATELNVGDFLVIGEDGVYCVRGEEFNRTHAAK